MIVILQTIGFSLLGSEAEDPSSFKELDRWYEVFLSGSKVGHAHCTMKLEGEDVVSQSIFNMKMNRAGISVTMSALEKTRETRVGKIKSFSGEIKIRSAIILEPVCGQTPQVTNMYIFLESPLFVFILPK